MNTIVDDIDVERRAIAMLRENLTFREGFRNHVYVDHLGNSTIGVGHLWHDGDPLYMADAQVWAVLDIDIDAARNDYAALFPSLRKISHVRLSAMLEVLFIFGRGWAKDWPKCYKACCEENWIRAGVELLKGDSGQASQWFADKATEARAFALASALYRGEPYEDDDE